MHEYSRFPLAVPFKNVTKDLIRSKGNNKCFRYNSKESHTLYLFAMNSDVSIVKISDRI